MRKKQIIDEGLIGVNPFKINLKIPVTKVTNAKEFRRDIDGVMHPNEYKYDRRECVKIYRFPGLRKTICGLSSPAHTLLLYICMKLEHNAEYVSVDRQAYMLETSTKSVNTYKSGANELIKYGFIAAVVDYADVFWINPAYFFNGNPVAKYPDNLDERGEFVKH